MKNMLRKNEEKIFSIISKVLIVIAMVPFIGTCPGCFYEPTNPNIKKHSYK